MAEFYQRTTPGERRLAVVEQGKLVEMHVHRDGDGPAAGTRMQARLHRKLGTQGILRAGNTEILLSRWPQGATEGQDILIEITRAAWPEHGRPRLARARALPPTADLQTQPAEWPTLPKQGLHAAKGWPGWLAEQWDDHFQTAGIGHVPIAGGSLQFTPTPALVAVDVDGNARPEALVAEALPAIARLIRLWRLGGNIVIDLPTIDKPTRQKATEALDTAMADLRFERTGINGFGLLQIVCERRGPSILERAWYDKAGTAAIAWLHSIRHSPDTGPIPAPTPGPVADWLRARSHLQAELSHQTHRPLDFDPLSGA